MDSNAVDELVRQVDADIAAAQARLRELHAVRGYILSLGSSHPQQNGCGGSGSAGTVPQAASGRFRDTSAAKAAAVVLRERGRPMHIKHIVRAILDGGYPSTPRKVRSTLSTNMHRQPDTFWKVRRATFGLAEWQRKQDSGTTETGADHE